MPAKRANRRQSKRHQRQPRPSPAPLSTPKEQPSRKSPSATPFEGPVWNALRQGARNVAGVRYQLAVTALLLAQSRRRVLPFVELVPEGYEDIDRPAPRPAAPHRAPPLGPGAHAAPPRRRRRVRRRRGGTGETGRPAWADGGARPGGLRSRVHGFRRPRDRTRARRSGGIAVGVTIWARAGGASGHGARRGVCAWRRRYQPTEARPSTPLPVPPINGLSRRCASTPNSNVTPSPPNAARL